MFHFFLCDEWMNKISIFRLQFYFLHILNAVVDLWPLKSCISLHVVHSWLALLKWTRQSAWFRVILEVEGKNDSLLEEFPKLNDRGMGFSPCMVSSVQSLSRVQLFATPWIAARQASLSITVFRSSLKLTSIELVMPSSHLILCRPLFLMPRIPHSIRVFSNESTLRMRWPKYWSFCFSTSPSKNTQGWSALE